MKDKKNTLRNAVLFGAVTGVAAYAVKKLMDKRDGQADVVMMDTTGDGQVDTVMEDVDGDGKIDIVSMDTTGDGEMDTAFVDLDGDGEPDMVITTKDEE